MSFRDLQDLANATELDTTVGLGEAATYTSPLPASVAENIVGVFGQVEVQNDVGLSTFFPVLDIRAADVMNGPVVGAIVVVRSVFYKVINVLGPDHADWSTLVLMLVDIPA